LILDQRSYVIAFKLLAARQKLEFNYKDEADDNSAQSLNEVANSFGSSTGSQQIVGDEHSMPIADGITMDFERVLTILEVIRD
jgi:hypothetical protein